MNARHPNPATFQRMARAIEYLYQHRRRQPSLAEVAAHVHLSPGHCQRQFSAWVGLSPKQLLHYLSLEHAKQLLQQQHSVLGSAQASGLSGGGRLHDLFMRIEGMTPGEYKHGGAGLSIHYQWLSSPFGDTLAAATAQGLCHLAFADDRNTALAELQHRFPQARLQTGSPPLLAQVACILGGGHTGQTLPLHLHGTPFQIKVWAALLRIPAGHVASYAGVAGAIGQPDAARAVGSAIAANPVALLIPCHRVIRASGIIGDYRWQHRRKLAMLGWELAQTGRHHAG